MSKRLLGILFFIITISVAYAQPNLFIDSTSSKISYHFALPIDKSVTASDAYDLVQQWVEKNASLFCRSNLCESEQHTKGVNDKNCQEVKKVFSNINPLQSLDPASGRLSAKVITRYESKLPGATLRLLYVEYYLLVTVSDRQISCTVSNMRYNHFNPSSYQLQRIFSYKGTYSCDPVNTVEYLVANEHSHNEFEEFCCFINEDLTNLFINLSEYIKSNASVSMRNQ